MQVAIKPIKYVRFVRTGNTLACLSTSKSSSFKTALKSYYQTSTEVIYDAENSRTF